MEPINNQLWVWERISQRMAKKFSIRFDTVDPIAAGQEDNNGSKSLMPPLLAPKAALVRPAFGSPDSPTLKTGKVAKETQLEARPLSPSEIEEIEVIATLLMDALFIRNNG
jgi:hypothetical protein